MIVSLSFQISFGSDVQKAFTNDKRYWHSARADGNPLNSSSSSSSNGRGGSGAMDFEANLRSALPDL